MNYNSQVKFSREYITKKTLTYLASYVYTYNNTYSDDV